LNYGTNLPGAEGTGSGRNQSLEGFGRQFRRPMARAAKIRHFFLAAGVWGEFLTLNASKIIHMNRLVFSRLIRLPLMLVVMLLAGAAARSQGPHFSHQTIFVTDLDRAANFYEKVMLLKRIPEPFHDGKHVWFRVSEHGQLHVVSGAKEDIPHDINIHLAFSVPSMEVFTKHLEMAHVKYGNWAQNSTTPQLRPDNVKQVYLQDPDGYWIEVNDDKF